MWAFAQRIGAYSAAIRQFARYFEDKAGADGFEDKIARMLDHAGDATPAALDAQFYERSMAIPGRQGVVHTSHRCPKAARSACSRPSRTQPGGAGQAMSVA